jgi:hypothetical protein
LVEFTLLVPLFLLVLLGVLEFGLAFSHNLTLEYATREGARTGAALADGTGSDSSCVAANGTSRALTANDVDPLIISAVQRVLESSGSLVNLSKISQIVIYKADANGGDTLGFHNVWTYNKGGGPAVPCEANPPNLDFKLSGSVGWTASNRLHADSPDHLGVSITYNYTLTTPLGAVMALASHKAGAAWSTITMTDESVMALEPTNPN